MHSFLYWFLILFVLYCHFLHHRWLFEIEKLKQKFDNFFKILRIFKIFSTNKKLFGKKFFSTFVLDLVDFFKIQIDFSNQDRFQNFLKCIFRTFLGIIIYYIRFIFIQVRICHQDEVLESVIKLDGPLWPSRWIC